MDKTFEILFSGFALPGAIAGVLIGFMSGYYGAFMVQRKMSFLGAGLAHSAFGGAALGVLLGLSNPLWAAYPYVLLMTAIIVWIGERTDLSSDAAIGAVFSFSMAAGIVMMQYADNYSRDAFTYLFGYLLAVEPSDLLFAGILTIITIGTTFKLWGKWAAATFDRELFGAERIRNIYRDYFLLFMIAGLIAASIKLVGILLISSFLVIPAAGARLISGTFRKTTIVSVIAGAASSILGVIVSIRFDIPTGPAIVGLQVLFFASAVLISKIRK